MRIHRFLAVALMGAALASDSEAQQQECSERQRLRKQCGQPAQQPATPPAQVPAPSAPTAQPSAAVNQPNLVETGESSDTIPPPKSSATVRRASTAAGRHKGTTFFSPRLTGSDANQNRLIYAELIRNGGPFRGVKLNTTSEQIVAGLQKYYPQFGVEDVAAAARLASESEIGECPSGIVKLAYVDLATRDIVYTGWERKMDEGINKGEVCLIKDGVAWASLLCGNIIVPATPYVLAPPVANTPSLVPLQPAPQTGLIFQFKERNGFPWGKFFIGVATLAVLERGFCEAYSRRRGYENWAFRCYGRKITMIQIQEGVSTALGLIR